MPYLEIQTNESPVKVKGLIKDASSLVAGELGKPESYVMVNLKTDQNMSMGGNLDPAAFLELKSIGLPESQTRSLSQTLCDFINDKLCIPEDRIYIKFVNSSPSMWGWNGDTF